MPLTASWAISGKESPKRDAVNKVCSAARQEWKRNAAREERKEEHDHAMMVMQVISLSKCGMRLQ
jgi:hypothetical protein